MCGLKIKKKINIKANTVNISRETRSHFFMLKGKRKQLSLNWYFFLLFTSAMKPHNDQKE